MSPGAPPWQGRSIASSKLRMLEFSAFLEQPQDPETVSRGHMRKMVFRFWVGKMVWTHAFTGSSGLTHK